MDGAAAIEMIAVTRGLTMGAINDLTDEQLVKVPEGFNNNILWNMGHILFYTATFVYGPSLTTFAAR